MKAFTWKDGTITAGLELVNDARLGPIVLLGERGKGRRYERVSPDQFHPPVIENGHVMDTAVRPIIPKRRPDGTRPPEFFVLTTDRKTGDEGSLVRIDTRLICTSGSSGYWQTVEGSPETIVTGHGIVGPIGTWDDGLVVMHSGDVLQICSTGASIIRSYGLWIEDGRPQTLPWRDYEQLRAVERARAIMSDPSDSSDSLKVAFRQMPAFTFEQGQITPGIDIGLGTAGPAVCLGSRSQDGQCEEVLLMAMEPTLRLLQATIVELQTGEPGAYDNSTLPVRAIYGLIQSKQRERRGTVLVRIKTAGMRVYDDSQGYWQTWSGDPVTLIIGYSSHGAAENSTWDDGLVVLHEGDIVQVHTEDASIYALFVRGGQLWCAPWTTWRENNTPPSAESLDALRQQFAKTG